MENLSGQQTEPKTEPTMNNAFQVWWWIGWRTALVVIAVNIVANVLFKLIDLRDPTTISLIQGVSLIIGILVHVFFFKKALNRKYKDFELVVKK